MIQDLGSCVENKTFKNKMDNSEKRYKTLFEHINAAVFLTTLEGEILEANQRACDFFGYRVNEMLCLTLKNFFTLDFDWLKFKEDISACGGTNIETLSICKDGTKLPVEISVSLFNMEDKPVMFVLIWDITERKTAEERLLESEKKYHGLFQYSTDGILMLDARGEIKDVNTKLCEIIDCKKDDIIGNNLFNCNIFTTKSLPSVVYQFEQLMSDKKAQYYTAQITNKNGDLYDVEVSSFFLVKKENEIDNFIIIIRDITERSKIEKNVVLEHGLLKTLMNTIPDSIYFKDELNRFILVNNAKAEHSNVTKDDMINKTDFDFLPEEQAKCIVEDDNTILQSGQPIINKIEKITHYDGTDRWISVTKVPRYSPEGEIIGTMGISRDITNQKFLEENLLRLQQKYHSIFENSIFAIIQVNENGKIESWNKLSENILKMNYDHLFGKNIKDFFANEDWDKIQASLYHNCQPISNIEVKINKLDNEMQNVILSINIIKDNNDEITGFSYIFYVK